MSIPLASKMPVPEKHSALNLQRPVLTRLILYIEEKVVSATHISKVISRSNLLFNPTGKKGDKHVLCAPPSKVVKTTFTEFNKQKSNFTRATFIVDHTPVFRRLFKDWDLLNVDEHYKDVNKPICLLHGQSRNQQLNLFLSTHQGKIP
jgi:hypothetical protein